VEQSTYLLAGVTGLDKTGFLKVAARQRDVLLSRARQRAAFWDFRRGAVSAVVIEQGYEADSKHLYRVPAGSMVYFRISFFGTTRH